MSESINPYAPPAAEVASFHQDPLRIGAIMFKAWHIFCERFVVIACTVLLVWIPCELLSSYMDAFVFGEDELKRSFKFSMFLDNLFGIIATAGVIHVALRHRSETPAGIGQALAAGFRNWPRMWWTRLLTNLVLSMALLILVVPFFYWYPRLVLVDSVTVSERISGAAAMRRSEVLLRGRYWWVTGILLLLTLIICIPMAALIALAAFEIIPDHWLADAATSVAFDIFFAYGTVCLYCTYEALAQQETGPSADSQQVVHV
ncbi:hypothetical protein [Prosthecobacter sp.]|uniref:hypothetical protein n=1 Tax=Prosthecobacter sp. TaxID=1965333 RepID=UPI00378380B2